MFCLPSEDDPERSEKTKAANNNGSNGNGNGRPPVNKQLIDQTTTKIKRLKWTVEQGKAYLQKAFEKQSRQELTEKELQIFLNDLKAQPTPTA